MGKAKRRKSPASPSLDELVERAEALAPAFRERAAETERARTPLAATMRDLFAAGLLRYFQPKRYGGWEMEWGAQHALGRVVARACPSTAWIVAVVGAHSAFLARYEPQVQDEIWGDNPDVLIATASVRRNATIKRVAGGYIVDGAWAFASGVDHAACAIVPGVVEDAGQPTTERIFCLLPRGEFTVEDTWHVSGMRGTGTKDVRANDLFVPAHRSLSFKAFNSTSPPGAALHRAPLYRFARGPASLGSNILWPMLGAAEGALADYIAGTRVRVGALFGNKPAEQSPVQLRLSESAAEIKAARLLLEAENRVVSGRIRDGSAFTAEENVELPRDRAFAAKLCVAAVERLVLQMGATTIYDPSPVRRHLRDLNAMATQVGVNWDLTMPPYARWALGLPVAAALGGH